MGSLYDIEFESLYWELWNQRFQWLSRHPWSQKYSL